MKTFYKLGLFLLFLLNFSFSVNAATIDLVRFNNTASYVPGSGVSVIINPTGVFELNNTFYLELSNSGGTFNPITNTILTSLDEFYVPVINGTLPSGLAPGNYKLRVRSTFPVLSVETNIFTVISGSGIGIPNFKSGIINDGSTKFNCLTDCSSIQLNNIYGQIDVAANNTTSILNNTELRGTICNPDTNATYQVNLINISNSLVTNLNLNAASQFSIPNNLQIGTYIIEIEKKISNKTSIFSNIFIFHGSATNINNLSSETVCVGNNVQFSIDATSNGIGRNYMGSKYTIDFGDGSPILTYTHAQLLQILTTPELISHTFNSVSCSFGTSPNIGYYILKLKLFNKGVFNSGGNANYCNQYYENGNGADKRVNTNRAPVADFTIPNKQCINTIITATNTTVLGQYGTINCLTAPRYYWYIKRPTDTDFIAIDSSFNPSWLVGNNLVIPAASVNISGCWQIKLEAQNAGAGCTTTTEMIKTIKIEVPATPSFTFSPQSPICPGTPIQFTSTSNVTSIPCQEPAYTWTVTPSTGVQFVNPTTASSANPLILFTQIGTYTVKLTVVNSCGTYYSSESTIVVSGSPTVSFNPSTLTVCSPSPPTYTIDFSQVGTTPTYSAIPFLPTSFAWTVSGTGVTASDYSFIGGTSATSQFPKITFTAYKTYSIQVVVNGNCPGSNQATFTFSLVAPPTMNVQPLLSQTICQGSTPTTLQATATGGNGAFSYQWYTNTNATTIAGTAIATATSSSFIPPSTSVGIQYYYCIISQPGIGCSVTSAIATVNIVAAPQIANQPASNSICQGGTLSSLSFTLNGATGTVAYQWYSNTNPSNTGGTSIPLATSSTYTPSSSTVGVFYYYCIITLSTGGCSNITSDFATITVNQLPTITTQPTVNSNLCVGSTILTPLSVTYSGGTGTATYQWYSNTTNSQTGGTSITGATNNSYTPPAFTLPGVYYFYCQVTLSGAGCGATTSSVATINVSADPTISAQPLPTQTLCQGATPTSLQVTATGGNGTFSYQWFSNINASTLSGTLITSATSSIFTPPTTTVGTLYYYCEITQITPGCGVTSAISTVVVNTSPSIQNQPVSSTICLGGTPTQMSVTIINPVGTPSYQWYSNVNDNTTSGTIIPGGISSTYSPPNTPIGTIYYYCIITLPSAGGCSNIVSNTAFVTINALATIDTQPLSIQDVCLGATLQTPLTVVHSGGTGTASYQWFSNTSNSPIGGSPIAGETNINFTPSTFTTVGTKYFYVVVTLSGSGCGAVSSSVASINVLADPTISAQPLPTQTLCQGATPTSLQVTATGGNGAFSYQWFSNLNATTPSGTAIASATSSTFFPPTSTVGTQYYYCEITQVTPGCGVTSAISTVVVNESPSIQNQPVSSTICLGGTPTQMSVTYINGVGTPSYQWYSNLTDNTTSGTTITGANASTYSPPNTPIGTIYYYCIITLPSTGGCSNIVSNTAFVTINGLPTIDTQPHSTQDLCEGATLQTPLIVAHSGGTGTASYQWFSNTSNSPVGGSPIAGETNINFTPSTFTTVGTKYFYVVVTLSGSGCGATTSSVALINVLADPTISAQPLTTQTLCQGTTPTSLTVSATGGIGNFTYQWYSNSPPNTLIPGATNDTYIPDTTVTGTTSYYCIVSQTGLGCQVTSNIADVVVVPAPVIDNQPQSSSICIGGSPSSLSVTYLNGTGTASYQWYDGTGSITGATNLSYSPVLTSTTSYYCIVTFSSGGCTSITSDTAVITVEPLPTIDIQPLSTQNLCVGGTIAQLTVSYLNGAGIPTYQWYSSPTNSTTGGTPVGTNSTNFTPPVFSASGTYYYYATVTLSGNGCGIVSSNSAEVVVVADPVLTTQPIPTQTICQGITPQSLTVTGTGGIGSFSYQWYSNTPLNTIIPSATNDTYIPDTTTTGTTNYYCVVSQPGIGCEAISNLSEVIVVPAPLITTQPQNRAVCEGQSVAPLTVAYINGAGNVTYQWFSNSSNSNLGGISISGANADSFTPPSISVGTVYYYCEITFSSGGCTLISTNTAEVNIYQYPVISTQNVVACSGDAFNFVPQIGGVNVIPANTQYTWNLISINPLGSVTGATSETTPQNGLNQTLINNTNQVATVTYLVTPIAGICTGNPFMVEVLVYPKPSVVFDLANQTICNETDTSLVTLSSSTPGTISFSWTASVPPGITGAILSGTDTIPVQNLTNSTTSPLTIDITAIGTFNYNGSGCNGPSSIYSITVNPTLLSSGTISSYNGYGVSFFGATDGFIDLTVTGGSGVYTYTWTGPNGFTASTEDLNGIAAGTYTVSINDGYCTPTVLTFTLTQPPELLFQEDTSVHVDLLCFGDSNGVLGITITQESVPPYDFQLINSNGIVVNTILSSTALNQSFSGLVADTYSVKIIDANGGVKILNGLIVTQPADIVITPTTTPITCYGANNASITLTVTGGTGPYQAVWDNLATGFYQNNLSAGTYTILVTDSNNCTKPISVFIPEALLFTVNPVVKNISCFGANDGSINLNFVGGIPAINLVWSDGSTAGTTRNNLGPGTYSVTIIDGTPCTIFRTFTIVEPQPLVVTASLTNALDCLNPNSGAINLIVSGGTPAYSYNWSNGSTTEDLLSITSGNYQIVVTDLNGCTNTKQYSILRPDPIQISVSTQTTFDCETHYVNQSFVADVVGGVPAYQLQWSSGTISGINNEIMQTNVNGIVTLTVTDNIGCQSNYTVNVDTPVLGFTSFEPVSYGYSTYGIYSIGDPIQFQSTVTGDYVSILWDFGDGTFSTELNPYHTYSIPKDYVVKQTVTYPFGCVYIQTISLIVENGYLLVVPTAFTPNQDTLNDKYRPVTKRLKNITLDIYDSWGSLIYSEKGDVITGWDGKIRGYDAENGNYYSKVSAETFYGTIINQNQTLVIIK